MRRLFLSTMVILLAHVGIAQEQEEVMRYQYQMSYPSTASLDNDSIVYRKEILYLDVKNGESRFVSEGNLKRQEIIKEMDKGVDFAALQERLKQFKTHISYEVYKTTSELNTYSSSGMDVYNLVEPTDLVKWTILPDLEEYSGMKVQKATGELSGRTWTVWFTQEIPLIEGPYKFKNLPGFVVKAEDSTKEFIFEFLNSEKATSVYWLNNRNAKAMRVDKKQWAKISNMNAKKTLAQILEESGKGVVIKMVDDKGKDITDSRMTKPLGKAQKPIEFY